MVHITSSQTSCVIGTEIKQWFTIYVHTRESMRTHTTTCLSTWSYLVLTSISMSTMALKGL